MRNLVAAAALLVLPAAANAALITGQLDLVGTINPNSTFAEDAFSVDFYNPGYAMIATGDFDSYIVDISEGLPTFFTMNDITGTGPAVVYSGGGFTFAATSFYNFVAAPSTPRGFEAMGVLSGNGFDDTPGIFAFSTQSTGGEIRARVSFSSETTPSAVPVPAALPLLGAALGGLGFFSRRKRKTA